MPTPTLRPLQGIRVLDLTMALAGPYAALQLGGMGAEVIHIEAPGGSDNTRQIPPFAGPQGLHHGTPGADDLSLLSLGRGRNKKSVTLNLKSAEGRALFMRLAAQSDVVLENMSDGTVQRLGVDYAAVQAANAQIVYASISAFGEHHAYHGVKGVDILVQALSGLMAVTGAADGPPTRVGLPIADLVTPLFAVNGILAALLQRAHTGRGQHVQVAMLDCMAALLAGEHLDIAAQAGLPLRTGNSLDRLVPFGVYACRDGHVAITAYQDQPFAALMAAMDQSALVQDPRFATLGQRQQHALPLNESIEHWTRQHSAAALVAMLWEQRHIPTVVVRTPTEVLHDPNLHSNGAIMPLQHPTLGAIGALGNGNPIRFSDAQAQFDQPAQSLGQSNAQVYGELLGLSAEDLSALHARGVV